MASRDLTLKTAILTLLLRNGSFCAAFNGFIGFGQVINKQFMPSKCFVIERKEYYLFFITFLQIAKAINGQSDVKKNAFLKKKNLTYFWEVRDNEVSEEELVIVLSIVVQEEVIFSIEFNLSEVNEFTLTIRRLIIPSLNVKPDESIILEMALQESIEQIESFKNETNCKEFLQKKLTEDKNDSFNALCILIMHYRDIIMLLHKLNSLICFEEEEEVFQLISN